jgi:hypothetical protein
LAFFFLSQQDVRIAHHQTGPLTEVGACNRREIMQPGMGKDLGGDAVIRFEPGDFVSLEVRSRGAQRFAGCTTELDRPDEGGKANRQVGKTAFVARAGLMGI